MQRMYTAARDMRRSKCYGFVSRRKAHCTGNSRVRNSDFLRANSVRNRRSDGACPAKTRTFSQLRGFCVQTCRSHSVWPAKTRPFSGVAEYLHAFPLVAPRDAYQDGYGVLARLNVLDFAESPRIDGSKVTIKGSKVTIKGSIRAFPGTLRTLPITCLFAHMTGAVIA